MDTIIVYVAVVIALFALIQGFLFFSQDIREETRETWSHIRRPTLADGVSPWLREILLSAPIRRFDNIVQTCGIKVRTETVLFGMMILTVLAIVTLNLYSIPSVLGAAIGLVLPFLILLQTRNRRMAKLTSQIPETLDMMVRSLRAGHPIPVSIGMIAKEMPNPIGGEFKRVYDTMSFGLDLRDALVKMTERLNTVPELQYLVSAIRIQSASGGNLAEVLGSLARLMRDQQKLKMKVKALAAEGRMSGNILACLPIGVFIILNIVAPTHYAGLLDKPPLMFALGFAGILVVAGFLVIRRICNIRV